MQEQKYEWIGKIKFKGFRGKDYEIILMDYHYHKEDSFIDLFIDALEIQSQLYQKAQLSPDADFWKIFQKIKN